jgi:glyoxylase-like metal-dependent hydrolase (beta-lactamase superfamily II)
MLAGGLPVMSILARPLVCCAVLALPVVASAADAPRYTVEKLADGVHAVLYNADVDVEGNTLIVINEEDVFVVDANAGLTTARATIEEIKKLTPKPVRYLVNTHWHDDHVFGNQAYAEAYPGVQVVAHPLTRQDVVEHAFASNAFVLDLIEADIVRLGGYLETNTYREGKPLTPELKTRVEHALRTRKEMLADRTKFRAVPPTVDVAESLTLTRGSRTIEIRFLGRGNTRGDLVVYLPKERIVATGDLVVAPVPYATNVYAQEWVKTLDRLMGLPATTVLPGHGPVMRDWTYVQRVKSTIEQTLAGVAAAKREGLSIAQATERVQLPELRDTFVQGIETRRAGYEAFFRPTLIRNAWEELDAEVMKAAGAATMKKVADGVYAFGAAAGGGLTVLVNEKDVVLVNPSESPAVARAAVRAMRELTDKPVRYVIVTKAGKPSDRGLEVFREAYTQADVVTGTASGTGIAVADILTLHRGTREIRITRATDGSLAVELPREKVRVDTAGHIEIALRHTL